MTQRQEMSIDRNEFSKTGKNAFGGGGSIILPPGILGCH